MRRAAVVVVSAVVAGVAWFGAGTVAASAAAAEQVAATAEAPAPAEATVPVEAPAAAEATAPAEATAENITGGVTGGADLAQGGDSGPELDPQTEADQENARSKLVVGLAAAALLGIIVWGRIIRKKRADKDN